VKIAVNRAMTSLVFGIVSVDFGVIAAFTAVLLLVVFAACRIMESLGVKAPVASRSDPSEGLATGQAVANAKQ
jgi:hypothetical protein